MNARVLRLSRRRVPRPRAAITSYPRAVDAMISALRVVPSWTPVASLVSGARRGAVYPVIDAQGALVGTVDLVELTTRPESHDLLVGAVCRPVEALSVLGPQDRVVPERLPGLVIADGRLVGILPGLPLARPRRNAS
ncbi:hypothetical protein [Sporichthya polymorpha]|uniref:hypothetical protein n=1 Tax=Sporichthya polymorpha TaxID=35751 RepID=UPI0003824BBA|nr:hypothetical protein [Sporichthya polymorpha]